MTMLEPEEITVRVSGMQRWDRVFAEQMRSVGVSAFVSSDMSGWPLLRRWGHTLREIVSLKIEHVLFPGIPGRLERCAKLLGKRVIQHFIGSDVLALQRMDAAKRRKRLALLRKYTTLFLSDSPELAGELAEMGVSTEVVRLLPLDVIGPIMSLPQQFRALSYWEQNPDLYRADIILQLARENPDVPFWIVGVEGPGTLSDVPPNVEFLGQQRMADIYPQVSVLLRLPRHDSISVMVLEALARGRHVLYSLPFPHTQLAKDLDQARAAFAAVRELNEPNSSGGQYVRQNFNPTDEAHKALAIYQRLLERQ